MVVVVDTVAYAPVATTLLAKLLTGRYRGILLNERLFRSTTTAGGPHGRLTKADDKQQASHAQAEAGTKTGGGSPGRTHGATGPQVHRGTQRGLPTEASSHPLPASRRQLALGLRPRLEDRAC